MRLIDFLQQLEAMFPLKESDEKKQRVFSLYVDVLEGEVVKSNKEYDFQKILHHLIRTHKYKSFPSVADIIEAMPIGEVTQYQQCKDDDALLVVTLPSGYQYCFTVSAIGKDKKTIEQGVERRYGQCEWQIYSQGAVIIGDKVFS
nr:MAG TPA: hypothetical protein [Caudoviricetes sp.]